MRRRQVLAGAGAITLAGVAGCVSRVLDDETETEGDDDDPIDADPEALLITVSQVEDVMGTEWEVYGRLDDDRELLLEAADVVERQDYVEETSGSGVNQLRNGVWVFETVSAARDAFDAHPYTDHGHDPADVAVESISGRGSDTAPPSRGFVLFRDANVMAGLSLQRIALDDEGEIEHAEQLAARMHSRWRD